MLMALAGLLFTGCNDDDEVTDPNSEPLPYENGALVLHEGGFGAGNASVSFIPDDYTGVENGIFKSVNAVATWGDTAQSMAFDGDLAYIVVNNSQKIEVVNRYTFETVWTIGGGDTGDFLNPRYMAIANGKGYVSNWGDGSDPTDDFIAVVNLEAGEVEAKIPVGEGPERLLAKDNAVYVAMQGGFGQNNIVSVIDAMTNTLSTTITVADRPNSLQLDADGNLWVLSGGNPSWTNNETAGQLDKISTDTNVVDASFTFDQTEHPSYLSVDEGSLYYYLNGAVFEMDMSNTTLPTEAAISGRNYYDMAVEGGRLYGLDAKDFASPGSVEIYNLDNRSLLTTLEVGINPGEVYFNGSAERQ
ncbi:YncE family protein [Maribacter sp. 2307ULW6-5]|uniref:YncE family protein n=1 Tax=Maribacter sp. 2307ULW6-5 TaxID=3386275 RepID=UPI0039BD6966